MTTRQRISDEFTLIARHFAPLATEPGAFNLTDDAAVLTPPPGHQVVITSDCLVADVHFRAADDPADIAAKVLRVNLSDLAAMGATPSAYTLAAAFPPDIQEDWIAKFAAGLADDQARFAITLVGGDTVSTPGPLTLTVTAFGLVADGQAVRRSTANTGDTVYVSGTLGDAALGLRYLAGKIDGLDAESGTVLASRYLRPIPRLDLGIKAAAIVTAAIDISDGLIADLGHVCKASAVDATVEIEAVPLSPAALTALDLDPDIATIPLTGGDDYELLLCAEPGAAAAIAGLAEETGVPLTAIGTLRAGSGRVDAIDRAGKLLSFEKGGFRHF
jgi:thiamine-monophosphate kinase